MPSDDTSFKINGMEDLLKNLESLPDKVLETMERKVLRTQLKKVMDSAMAKIPVVTGNLKAHFRIRVKKDKARGQLFGQLVNDANHAHLLEFGHVMRSHLPNRKYIKIVEAQPFMRPALAENSENIIRESQEAFESAFEKFTKKNKG